MIKLDHVHEDGKQCIAIRSRLPYKTVLGLNVLGVEYAAGYMPYTGQWYVFELATGQEVATFSKRHGFFEVALSRYVVGPCEVDPDCKPLRKVS